MWNHLKHDFVEVAWHIGQFFRTLGACLFGEITHDGWAVTWRGMSYRIKDNSIQKWEIDYDE